MILSCLFKGHEWDGAGWGKAEPAGITLYWICVHCGKRAETREMPDVIKAGFDGYRAKYGEQYVVTDEFASVPPPAGRIHSRRLSP